MFLVTAMTLVLYLHRFFGGVPAPQCRFLSFSGIVEVLMELSVGQSDSHFKSYVGET